MPPKTLAPTPTAPTTTPTVGQATPGRMALLRPVPGRPGIYAYTVRPGDVFESIANWFGVSVESMRRLNPTVKPRLIHPGQVLLLPTPTR